MVCLSSICTNSPFICSEQCDCYQEHSNMCSVRLLQQLISDMDKVSKFQFMVVYSPTLKGSSIEVMGRFAEQTQNRPNNQNIALTMDPVGRNSSINQIQFKLTKVQTCVGMGLFSAQVILKNQFRYLPDANYLAHGAYMLTSSGILFSSSDSEENCSEVRGWNLIEGSKVKIKALCEQGIVKFTSQNGRIATLKLPKSEQQLYFGVYLYQKGDSIEIMNRKI